MINIMNVHSDKYSCKVCNKIYSSASSLWNHNNKFHSDSIIKNQSLHNQLPIKNNHLENNECDTNIKCKYCDKIFSHYNNKWRHEKSCKKNKLIILENENIKLKTELETIKNTNKNITNIQNTNSNNNINNGTINNYVVINKFGTEKITDLPISDIKKIINSENNSIITCTKKVNFNKNLPQYHSFCTTTLEGDHFTKINHITQKPEKINKKDFINEVLINSIKFLNDMSLMIEFDEEFRNKISVDEQRKIKEIVKYQDKFHEIKNKRAFYQSINDISYNCKDLILKTWELVQPTDDNYDSDESEPIVDADFRGYETSDSE